MDASARYGRRRRAAIDRLTVTAGLIAFVLAVYVLVVLGGGAVIGRTESPHVGLSVLATAVVALLLARVQALLERALAPSARSSATPAYDVLRRFSAAITADRAPNDLPERMAMLLAQGTGARWAQVWLMVSGELTLAASWPPDSDADADPPDADRDDADGAGRRSLAVRHGSTLLGVLRLQERPGQTLTLVEVRLFRGLAAQAGLVLRLVALQAELERRRADLVLRAQELQSSRERLVQTQDAERRRLERDLHDGAQQHLVALAVNLRLAQEVALRSGERSSRILREQADAAGVAIETLTSLSRGIYPRLLSDHGLLPALRGAAAASALDVTVIGDSSSRPPADVEATLYFCGMEAVQNAAKHSGGRSVVVRFDEGGDVWRLSVHDDGSGFGEAGAAASSGGGLANMRDRLDAVGGDVAIDSRPGEGTTVTASVAKRTTACSGAVSAAVADAPPLMVG